MAVNGKVGAFTAPKNGKTRTIALHPRAANAIARMPQVREEIMSSGPRRLFSDKKKPKSNTKPDGPPPLTLSGSSRKDDCEHGYLAAGGTFSCPACAALRPKEEE